MQQDASAGGVDVATAAAAGDENGDAALVPAVGTVPLPYYTLSFTVVCTHSDDVVYLAQCYPYTFTKLQRYLGTLTRLLRRLPRRRPRVTAV